MTLAGARLSQGFSLLGHAYMHLLVALFLTIVLVLERGCPLRAFSVELGCHARRLIMP